MASKDMSPRQKIYRENLQLIHDGMKHLTTLSTGSIVVIATFLEKLFNSPSLPQLVVFAIVLFFASVFFSTFTMYGISKSMIDLETDTRNFNKLYFATIICFSIGITLLAVFAGINLWNA